MSDKNVYESIRDDTRSVATNALGVVILLVVLVLIALYYIVVAIFTVIAFLLVIAAFAVLLTIPTYICLEFFYYRRFASATSSPPRFNQRRKRLTAELNRLTHSRLQLEQRLRLLSEPDQREAEGELIPRRIREEHLRKTIRDLAMIEANWLAERLRSIGLKRRAVLRRFTRLSDAALQERILVLDNESETFEAQLNSLQAVHDVTPNEAELQPAVVYIRQLVHAPLRFVRVEPVVPRISTLLSHWLISTVVVIAAGLAIGILLIRFQSELFR